MTVKKCPNKTCLKYGEMQPLRNFSKRAKQKKDGTASYSSHCKKCNQKAQSARVSKSRAKARELREASQNTCTDCQKPITQGYVFCQSCAATYRARKVEDVDKYDGTVDKKWLHRDCKNYAGYSYNLGA